MKASKNDDGNVHEKSNQHTEPTNNLLAKIGIGENVWVKQGRTEHMATFLGETRKVMREDGVEASTEEEQYEAMIRWTTTGTTCYVKASCIRPMMDGQRRRRQVVKHYNAVPSQRPSNPKKRKKKIEAPKDQPSIHNQKGENDEAKRETTTTKPFSFPKQLPTAEEFQKYQENLQQKKEKKERKKLIRKRMRGSTNGGNSTAMNDAETPENDSKPLSVGTKRRRISESEGEREREDETKKNTNVLRAFRKNNDDVEDPSLTIDRGYRWEWEKPESNDKPEESLSEQKKSIKLLPKNFGEGKPRCWTEAYMMILEFQRNNNEGEETKCEIPSDHPLLGKFVVDIRAEYVEFRKRIRKQQQDNPGQNADQHYERHPSQDLTRVTRRRIRQLRKIGFRWRSDSKSSDQSLNSEKRAAIDSDSEEENSDMSSLDDSSMDSFSSSRSDRSITSHREDHNNDDELLIVRSLSEIQLTSATSTNMSLIRDKKPTFPVQLYRLLRLSALNPKLGLNKIIRWNDEGDGFWMLDNNQFRTQILPKASQMTNIVSFRNALNAYNFKVAEYGKRVKVGDRPRLYKHKSFREAQEADDLSLRLFYRGAPLEVLWKIKNRIDENRPLDEVNKKRKRKDKYRQPMSQRRTENGCLLPRREPYRFEDGTYKKPGGHTPHGMTWDEIRGIWVPITLDTQEKGSLTESSASVEESFSSSSGGDATIIKASKEKLLQHSSSVLRLLLNVKKRKRRHRRNVHQTQIFQARTKSNPSGIVTNSINLSNWQKIENLKRRSSQQRNTGIPCSPTATSTTFSNEEALV